MKNRNKYNELRSQIIESIQQKLNEIGGPIGVHDDFTIGHAFDIDDCYPLNFMAIRVYPQGVHGLLYDADSEEYRDVDHEDLRIEFLLDIDEYQDWAIEFVTKSRETEANNVEV